MKKFIVMFVVLTFITSPAVYAKSGHGWSKTPEQKEAHIQKKMDKMTKEFDLTADQQTKVEGILRAKMDKKYAAKKRMKDEMTAISDEFKTKMNGVLNADQKVEFDKMVSKYEKKKHGKRKRFFFF